ncbi:hypothetical protein AQJ23_01525 [Streptomyces antibioticus]|nr:hypothetical protein AQJ23_01525 [Streptomyces antibioticus]
MRPVWISLSDQRPSTGLRPGAHERASLLLMRGEEQVAVADLRFGDAACGRIATRTEPDTCRTRPTRDPTASSDDEGSQKGGPGGQGLTTTLRA